MIGRGASSVCKAFAVHAGPPFDSPAPHNEPVRGLQDGSAGRKALPKADSEPTVEGENWRLSCLLTSILLPHHTQAILIKWKRLELVRCVCNPRGTETGHSRSLGGQPTSPALVSFRPMGDLVCFISKVADASLRPLHTGAPMSSIH